MTTFYRTPDVVIDAHEWHVIVWAQRGHVSVAYRFRPIAAKTYKWQTISTWRGPKPLGLWKYFAKYRKHIEFAKGCATRRRAAVAALATRRAPPTGAMVANAGRLDMDVAA